SALLNTEGWVAILADVLGQPVTASAEPEASSRGAALLTLQALGLRAPQDLPAQLGKTYQPNMKHHTIYRRAMQRQSKLYESYQLSAVSRGLGGLATSLPGLGVPPNLRPSE